MHFVIDIPNLTPEMITAFCGSIFVGLVWCFLAWTGGFLAGRKQQRRIEDTALLVPFEHDGRKGWIRLYDSREVSFDGKGRDI